MADNTPKWHRELDLFRSIKPCLILEGNIFDSYRYPEDGSIASCLSEYLYNYFTSVGYEIVVMYDDIRGFHNPYDPDCLDRFEKLTGARRSEFRNGRGGMSAYAGEALRQNQVPTVVIMNYASRYIVDPAGIHIEDVDGYTVLLQAMMEAQSPEAENGRLKNLCVLLVNKLNDIPAWFYLNNPHVKPIVLQTPNKEERAALIKGDNFASFFQRESFRNDFPFYEQNPDELAKIQDKFIGLTEGFTFTELNALRQLCRNQNISIAKMCSVIDLYKFGIQENPWGRQGLLDSLKNAEADFEKRVKGQSTALNQTLDVVKRAITGMSNITASAHGKPKGVLFFAGPTGTGKTETAKTLAEKLFGDESACIRFDMSEFSQPHSDQRLLGAPPGYVGYEAGGQLTNAVKNNPFSILLFDEIEKAHPSILDKFLQILEDGRMTDGKGETVYFSECIIIFTSNLGIYEMQPNGQRTQVVTSAMTYPEVRKQVRAGIERYFKQQLGRPEILNRIGENIVVFDFIREDVAEMILRGQLEKIRKNMKAELNVDLDYESVFNSLLEKALENLDNGGRGIGNIVESMFINPISRYMFDSDHRSNCGIKAISIQTEQPPYTMECRTQWSDSVQP